MRINTILFALAALCSTHSLADNKATITVQNSISSARMEMVETNLATLQHKLNTKDNIIITDADGNEIPSQITYDGKIIFQAGVGSKGKSIYYAKAGTPQKYETKAKGRLFTERGDEFGWENDKVAYRIYGHGGAVGYDLFNKSTSELMLDYWYASEQNQEMRSINKQLHDRGYHDLADQVYNAFCYHINHGKGMDCYTVGPTLGGGANALLNADGSLFMPLCYKTFKILDQGPLRFTVELTYPERDYDGQKVVEKRVITLDAGSQFNKVAVSYNGLTKPAPMAAGTVIHKSNANAYVMCAENGYIGYEDLGDASVYNAKYRDELSKQMGHIYIGLLFPDTNVSTTFQARENGIAIGHIIGKTTYKPGSAYVYYFGSGWDKNAETGFTNLTKWEEHLNKSAYSIRNPMKVKVK